MDKWIVDVKGGPDDGSHEISVLRSSNAHGRLSYGWFDKSKLLVSSSGGPCRDPLDSRIWPKMLRLAQEVADELNDNDAQSETRGGG